jgi:uncharacterized glyoxalase superfamily protein PhnB
MDAPAQPMLHAASLAETMTFYVDRLGFDVEATWPEDAPTWCLLTSGPVRLMFTCELSVAPALTGSLYFYPDDVDAFFAAVTGEGTAVLTAPRDEPWGMREFALEDPNGYLLKFGQPVIRL